MLRYVLETKIPGAHDRHDDDVSSSKATMTRPKNLNIAGITPRLVDGPHEDHVIPGYDHLDSEEWGSHNFFFKILVDQGILRHLKHQSTMLCTRDNLVFFL